jgi:hypothetical protein
MLRTNGSAGGTRVRVRYVFEKCTSNGDEIKAIKHNIVYSFVINDSRVSIEK